MNIGNWRGPWRWMSTAQRIRRWRSQHWLVGWLLEDKSIIKRAVHLSVWLWGFIGHPSFIIGVGILLTIGHQRSNFHSIHSRSAHVSLVSPPFSLSPLSPTQLGFPFYYCHSHRGDVIIKWGRGRWCKQSLIWHQHHPWSLLNGTSQTRIGFVTMEIHTFLLLLLHSNK